ncbi:hypothetical protein TrLO_g14767 [Triparma laevis f. longispina]|uniref:BTB domain-containing protein n=1 Tax=Triparma laevis f. longispina TaxID=1714387 RepID=A0A9W7DX26_9STRA|nr:hypothetical protein TrLO_g14767 [Triparma laevis f. longispina]
MGDFFGGDDGDEDRELALALQASYELAQTMNTSPPSETATSSAPDSKRGGIPKRRKSSRSSRESSSSSNEEDDEAYSDASPREVNVSTSMNEGGDEQDISSKKRSRSRSRDKSVRKQKKSTSSTRARSSSCSSGSAKNRRAHEEGERLHHTNDMGFPPPLPPARRSSAQNGSSSSSSSSEEEEDGGESDQATHPALNLNQTLQDMEEDDDEEEQSETTDTPSTTTNSTSQTTQLPPPPTPTSLSSSPPPPSPTLGTLDNPIRVGGGAVLSSDVLLILVAKTNLSWGTEGEKIVEEEGRRGTSIKAGQQLYFVMSKTDNVMKHLFKGYMSHYNLPSSLLPQLAFCHVQPLIASETLEQSFLMKEDRVYVSLTPPPNLAEKDQTESDRIYFQQIRSLCHGGDVVFECKGEEKGQKVISCRVKAHGFIVKKRCKWLKIKVEEEEERRRDENPNKQENSSGSSSRGIIVEDEDRTTTSSSSSSGSGRAAATTTTTTTTPRPLTINLPNVSPSAFKIFLEYLYTNRVPSLGGSAHYGTTIQETLTELDPDVAVRLGGGGAEPSEDNFLNGPNTYWHVNKPKPSSNPYNTEAEWPNGGRCDLGMGLVLGVLGLAVDARMKRLARMCEFAALDILDHSYHTSDCLSAVRSCVESERKGLPQRLLEEKSVSRMLDRNVWRSARPIVMNMDQSLQASFVKLLMKNISDKVTPLLPDRSISNNEKQAYFATLNKSDQESRNYERRSTIFQAIKKREKTTTKPEYPYVVKTGSLMEKAQREYYADEVYGEDIEQAKYEMIVLGEEEEELI